MSSVKSISAANAVPTDLAAKLGSGGIKEILEIMWIGFHDLRRENIITASFGENRITQEWYIRVSKRWYSKNRAARMKIHITPITQYADDTMAISSRNSPTIDFCFRAWNIADGYFGAECKLLKENDDKKAKRYVETGVKNFISGRYGSSSSVSSMIGYILSGDIFEHVKALEAEIQTTAPKQNLSRELLVTDPQYKTKHMRKCDHQIITLHHLFFEFIASA